MLTYYLSFYINKISIFMKKNATKLQFEKFLHFYKNKIYPKLTVS